MPSLLAVDGHRDPPLRINWWIAIACAAFLTIVFSTQNSAILGGAAASQSWLDALRSQALNWALWLLLLPLVFGIGARGRAHGVGDFRNVALQLLAGIAITILHDALQTVVLWIVGSARGSLPRMLPAMISFMFASSFLRYWLIAAAYHALAYQRESRERDAREAGLAAMLASARLESIENRLHPHFLFNTLNAITALIRKDPPAAASMVGHLSDLLRAALDAEPGREVTLARELELLARYTSIQQTRFSDRLHITVDVEPGVLTAYVPQMILQPIVENAISHGIAPREAAGMLTIEAMRRGELLRLVVRDDGVGFGRAPDSTQGKGLGINGTRERLSHFYGPAFAFDIAPASPNGTVVTIDIPFHADAPRGLRVVA